MTDSGFEYLAALSRICPSAPLRQHRIDALLTSMVPLLAATKALAIQKPRPSPDVT
jgi:hypothetical protein